MIFRRTSFAIIGSLLFCQCAFGMPNLEKGKQREYYPNGKVRLEKVYKNGLVIRSRAFYENGKLQSEFRYTLYAVESSRTFYENGVLRSEWSKTTGIMKFYDRAGNLIQQGEFHY